MSPNVSTRLRLLSDQATSSNCGRTCGEFSVESFLLEGVCGGVLSMVVWTNWWDKHYEGVGVGLH